MRLRPCSHEHVVWCWRTSEEVFKVRLVELKKVHTKDITRIDKTLVWRVSGDVFMRVPPQPYPNSDFYYEQNGLTAHQCFLDWDGRGVTLPSHLEEPELLMDLIQAKKLREFTINEWQTSSFNWLVLPEELLSHPGMDIDLFQTLFDRNPILNVILNIWPYGIPELR